MVSLHCILITGRFYDLSITPETPKRPDFKVSTIEYQVESGTDWGRLGDTDDISGKLRKKETDVESELTKNNYIVHKADSKYADTVYKDLLQWTNRRELW